MATPRLVLVTGANRGIGKAICQSVISRQHPSPLKLFAASRKGESIAFDLAGTHPQVLYPRLDIASGESIQSLATEMHKQGWIDALINNAGVNLDAQYSPEAVKTTLDVNFRGVLQMCQAFIPLLSPHGRIVNLSSVASTLKPYSPAIQQRFRDPNLSLDGLEQLAQEYEHSVRTHSESASGFGEPVRAYAFSKACVTALTAILARLHPEATINACCPGWVATDMGALVGSARARPPKSPAEGARIPVRLALDEEIDGVSGKYWANDSVRSREAGKVQEW